MIVWPDLALPPINLWNAPRLERRVMPAVDRKQQRPTGHRSRTDAHRRMQALLALR